MRRTLALTLVGVGVLLATPASVSYVAFEQITVAGTAIGFTAASITPAGRPESNAQLASCRLRTAQISFTYDGTTPTATVGELLEVGDRIEVRGHDLLRLFRGIRTTGTSGQLDCHYLAP
jgi:hypothetical protein